MGLMGCNPTVRGFKGVGFNRALPAPFSFDNGLVPDGVNDSLLIQKLAGDTMYSNQSWSIEFWCKPTVLPVNRYFLHFTNSGGGVLLSIVRNDPNWNSQFFGAVIQANTGSPGLVVNTNHHIVYNYISTSDTTFTFETYVNGMLQQSYNNTRAGATSAVIGNAGLFNTWNAKTDEFRWYTQPLTLAEVQLNYNNGIGNNPCKTEFLKIWYQFQLFESLDFSAAQDGSDMRTGIRDMSGHNYHGQAINMDTNPVSGTYCLQPY